MLEYLSKSAGVSESADEADSKSVAREGVWVQVPSPALAYLLYGRYATKFALRASDVDFVSDVHFVNDVTPDGVVGKHHIIASLYLRSKWRATSLCVA